MKERRTREGTWGGEGAGVTKDDAYHGLSGKGFGTTTFQSYVDSIKCAVKIF